MRVKSNVVVTSIGFISLLCSPSSIDSCLYRWHGGTDIGTAVRGEGQIVVMVVVKTYGCAIFSTDSIWWGAL